MLNERFFVPVIRCSDGSLPPHIGQPFSSNEPPVNITYNNNNLFL